MKSQVLRCSSHYRISSNDPERESEREGKQDARLVLGLVDVPPDNLVVPAHALLLDRPAPLAPLTLLLDEGLRARRT